MGTNIDSTDCSNELRMISQHPHFNLMCPNSNLTLILHPTTSQGRHTSELHADWTTDSNAI